MDLFEQGRLKGQKLKLSSLQCKPDFKQQYLTPIRALTQADQMILLTELVELKISLQDLKAKANNLKCLYGLKAAFVKLTNSESWETAKARYPGFTSKSQLARFMGINMKKGVPQSFRDFCQRAKVGSSHLEEGDSLYSYRSQSGVPLIVNVLCYKFTEISGQVIKHSQPSFAGIDLALVSIEPEVCS